MAQVVGVISDTHGYFDPSIATLFRGVDHVIHAGDIGSVAVIEALEAIAPVTAVRGNVDRDARLLALPERVDISLGGVLIQVVHRAQDAVPTSQTRVVICGHSHRPLNVWRGPILFLNPGAAGRQGFHTERTVSLLELGDPPSGRLQLLGPKSARPRAT